MNFLIVGFVGFTLFCLKVRMRRNMSNYSGWMLLIDVSYAVVGTFVFIHYTE